MFKNNCQLVFKLFLLLSYYIKFTSCCNQSLIKELGLVPSNYSTSN